MENKSSLLWFFDLDNTLYHSNAGAILAIEERMDAWLRQKENITRQEAALLRRDATKKYGALAVWIKKHYAGELKDFLHRVHDIPLKEMIVLSGTKEKLRRDLLCLPGRKVLTTNAEEDFACRVLRYLGIDDVFSDVFSVTRMLEGDYEEAKPSPNVYLRALNEVRQEASNTIVIDDNADNLKAAKSLGMKTVWFLGYTQGDKNNTPCGVDVAISDLTELRGYVQSL